MSHIFISYSHQDSTYAHDLATALEKHGLVAWIDERIDYGTHWPHVLEERLRECAAVIVIMTPHSHQSAWVQNELTYAQSRNKPIFPLLLSGDVWLSVAATQYVDVTTGKQPPQRFFKHISQVLSAGPGEQRTSKQSNMLYPKKDSPKEETDNLRVESTIIKALGEYQANDYLSEGKDKLVVGEVEVVSIRYRNIYKTHVVGFYGLITKFESQLGVQEKLSRLGWTKAYRAVMAKELFLRKEQLSGIAEELILCNKILGLDPKSINIESAPDDRGAAKLHISRVFKKRLY